MKTWAIVVGINEYPAPARQSALAGAVADACDFADWALDPAGGNVAPERLYFWTYPWPAAADARLQAYLAGARPQWDNRESVLAAPDPTRPPDALEIAGTIERVGRDARTQAIDEEEEETRRVYVFFAGHGIRARNVERTEETCFLAGDFRPRNSNMATGLVPCESLRKALLNSRFDEAILFTDCCRSETSRTTLMAQPVSDYNGDPISPWGIAFAAQDGEPAYELPGPPARGVFSTTLMNGLRGHRPGPAGELHVAPLRDYVLAHIGAGQIPNLLFRPDPHGPLIVAGPPPAAPPPGPIVDVSALPAGTALTLKGGDNKPVPDVGPLIAVGADLQLPPLPPGLYEIAAADGRHAFFRHPGAEPIHVR